MKLSAKFNVDLYMTFWNFQSSDKSNQLVNMKILWKLCVGFEIGQNIFIAA